jgi:hypothetical protein
MPTYLHSAGGLLNGSFPWSITMVSTSSGTESAAHTAWDSGIVAMFGLTAFLALTPAANELTFTSTSTANSSLHQTTKTQTTHSTFGTGGASLPYQVGEVVTWRSTQATKWGHGRWYLPPLTVASLASTGFVLSSTSVTTIVNAVNAGLAAWVGTLQFQIKHTRGTLTGPAVNTLTPISSGDVANKLVIQKRRADKLVPARTALTF